MGKTQLVKVVHLSMMRFYGTQPGDNAANVSNMCKYYKL